jgi:hypothetical protein
MMTTVTLTSVDHSLVALGGPGSPITRRLLRFQHVYSRLDIFQGRVA